MSNLILVVGGTGMLGKPVVAHLLEAGLCVRVMSRCPEKARAQFGNEVELIGGDVEDPTSLEAALKGCWGVHLNLRQSGDPDLERRGAVNMACAAVQAGVQRISYLSGASVFAENCWFDGTKAKFEAEAALRASGIPYFIFKATWFMEALNNFVREIGGKKRALQIGRHPNPYHWVAADDYARMVAAAYANGEVMNKEFFIYGPSAYTMRQALEVYCRAAHPNTSITYMPLWAAHVMARLGKRAELKAALPFFGYMERVQEGGDPAEANALLGKPATSLEAWSRAQKH